jgi:hypothetical protein
VTSAKTAFVILTQILRPNSNFNLRLRILFRLRSVLLLLACVPVLPVGEELLAKRLGLRVCNTVSSIGVAKAAQQCVMRGQWALMRAP